mgnify:CR=1 FL=1
MFPSDYERRLKDEIWGCFKYIGIPMDTIMNMPIQDRKYYIMKHNAEQGELQKQMKGDKNATELYGEALNRYADIVQGTAAKKR